MITTLLFDLSKVFLFAKDKGYTGELNALHSKLKVDPNYKFFDHFEFNEELINYIKNFKENIDVYMFTSGTIQETPQVKMKIGNLFKDIFSAEKLNLPKTAPASYIALSEMIGKSPEEILFIDDSSENLTAAQKAQFSTILFTNNLQFVNDLKNFIDFTV
jgi:FMN phosphatase YigB (HAD superfamily)